MTDIAYESDLEYLEDELSWVELRCKRLIVTKLIRELSGDLDGMFYDVPYVGHDTPLEALLDKRKLLDKDERAKRFHIEGRLAETRATGRAIALDTLCEMYGLDQMERWVLLLASASTFSRRFSELYGRIWDGYQTLTVEAVFTFCELPFGERIGHFKRFAPTAPLLQHDLVSVNFGARITAPEELLTAQIRIANRTFDFLVGDRHFTDEFMDFSSVEEPRASFEQVVLAQDDKHRIRSVVQRHDDYLKYRKEWGFDDIITYGRGALMLFYGPPGTGKTMMAHAVASEMGKRVLNVDIPTFANHYDAERFLPSLFREAKMQNAVLFFDECELLFESRAAGNGLMTLLLTEIERFEGVAILATNLPENLDDALERRILVRVRFPEPDRAARRAIWEKHLPATAPIAADVDLDALADRFEMTGGYIKNAVLMAVADAVHSGELQITMASLDRAARQQCTPSVSASSRASAVRLSDVVAPPEVHAQLEEVVCAARNRRAAVERAGVVSTLRGLTVVIAGDAGVGKTLAAHALAGELNRRVIEVALPFEDSKETMVVVREALQEARKSNGVVVIENFDVALGSGRTDWFMATLQGHEGVIVLTSREVGHQNSEEDYFIELPYPDEAARAEIWRRHLPAGAEDVERAAQSERWSGKQIARVAARALLGTDQGG